MATVRLAEPSFSAQTPVPSVIRDNRNSSRQSWTTDASSPAANVVVSSFFSATPSRPVAVAPWQCLLTSGGATFQVQTTSETIRAFSFVNGIAVQDHFEVAIPSLQIIGLPEHA